MTQQWSIAQFPDFSPLRIALHNDINRLVSPFESYSDFNFISLFCWNTDNSTEVSLLNNNLAIRMPGYLDSHKVYSILGSHKVDESVETLLGQAGKLELVPEIVVQNLTRTETYKIEEDEDNFDYIYELSQLSELSGGKFKKKRHKTNSFIRDHKDYELEVKTYHKLSHDHAQLLRKVDRLWAQTASRDEGDILNERKMLDRLLENMGRFDLIIVEVLVEGELKAFSVNEDLGGGVAICHFEKALKVHHENIYTFLASVTAKELIAIGCKWVNWEQDMGLSGLRESKRSYHPAKMLKKYTIQS